MQLEGGIFDIDGVLLDTPHEEAWRSALEEMMAGPWRALVPQTRYTPGAFTPSIYQEHIAGKPRAAGAAAVLAHFGVPDPDGERAKEYAAAKQSTLERLAATGDVRVYDDAVLFLLRVKAAGVRVCAASSSKNADGFLRAVSVHRLATALGLRYPFVETHTTLLDLFDANVNGRDVPRGKPDPALFLAAAGTLAMEPSRCFVVEDAPAGIAAAKAGGMYAIAVERQDPDALRASHPDLMTTHLDSIDVAVLLSQASGAAS